MKVSVIIPVYNAESSIKKCLDSIINQTLDKIEIIVINDGSTDNTGKILKEYNKNPNITIINKHNEGIGKTRNIGISKASGEYITFVDSDDYIDKEMFEKFYKYAKKNDMDLVTGTYYKDLNGNITEFKGSKFKIGNVKTNPKVLFLIEYGPCAKFFRREMLIKNNIYFEENIKYEDFPFVAKALLKSNLIGRIEKPYYYYVIHGNSETTTMDYRVFDILINLKTIMNYYKKEYYLKEELNFLIIDKTTNYMLQQRVQKSSRVRKEFITKGYEFLEENIPSWKKNSYYIKTNFLKRFIKNNKFILEVYCYLYAKFKRI